MLVDLAILACGIVMAAAGVGAVMARSLLVSIILSGGLSLVASLVFLLMGAPDVAMTEAAIGSGLTTVVYLYALARARQADDEEEDPLGNSVKSDAVRRGRPAAAAPSSAGAARVAGPMPAAKGGRP